MIENGKKKSASKEHIFIIDVKGTQNSTWQGTITWTEEQKQVAFRSTLELIRLLDSAIGTDALEETNWEKS